MGIDDELYEVRTVERSMTLGDEQMGTKKKFWYRCTGIPLILGPCPRSMHFGWRQHGDPQRGNGGSCGWNG